MLETGEIDAAYAKAEAMLAAGLQITPNAAPLLQLREDVARRKERFLSELAEQYRDISCSRAAVEKSRARRHSRCHATY